MIVMTCLQISYPHDHKMAAAAPDVTAKQKPVAGEEAICVSYLFGSLLIRTQACFLEPWVNFALCLTSTDHMLMFMFKPVPGEGKGFPFLTTGAGRV